jgi:single-strand DNA-binding protein
MRLHKNPETEVAGTVMTPTLVAEYNKTILIGQLTRDPELRFTPAGTAVCEFPIGVPYHHRIQDETKKEICFVDVVAFGKRAEQCKEHLHRGSDVLVEGCLAQRRWEGPDGRRMSKYEVLVQGIQFLSKSQEGATVRPTGEWPQEKPE